MAETHIVGSEHSFTYEATRQRYPRDDNRDYDYVFHETHTDLVSSLLNNEISSDDPAVVPLWNSNTGIVDMDHQPRTAKLFLSGRLICDLWPKQIVFKLAIKEGSLTDKSNFFSVTVAESQCSRFLNKINVLGSERFIDSGSTTSAADRFLKEAGPNDILLCSDELIKHKGLKPLTKKVTNPNNFTIFSTVNKLPSPIASENNISLGCAIADLIGNELPSEFIRYYKSILTSEEIQNSEDVSITIPKILFVLRYEESKALILMEMNADSFEGDPWPEPDIDLEEPDTQRLDMRYQIGRIYEAFTKSVALLFKDKFEYKNHSVFYGFGACYTWTCPELNISVQGFDKDLVRSCAKTQVLHLKALVDAGENISQPAQKTLELLEKNMGCLNLSPDSEPTGP